MFPLSRGPSPLPPDKVARLADTCETRRHSAAEIFVVRESLSMRNLEEVLKSLTARLRAAGESGVWGVEQTEAGLRYLKALRRGLRTKNLKLVEKSIDQLARLVLR